MRILRFLTIVFALLASPVLAEGIGDMSAEEREIFREEVRAYLLDNPEVIIEAVQVLEQREAQVEAANDQTLVRQYYEPLTDDGFSFVAGNPDGAITIIEFADYRCGFCKRAHPQVQALLEANDDVRLIIKEYPILGDDSVLAARAAVSILMNQKDVYLEFSDLLMSHNGPVNATTLNRIAENAGADIDLMTTHMNDDVVTAAIASNHALGRQMNISGTPTFIIGTEMIRGYVPLAGMQQIVDSARAQLQ